MHKYHYLLYRIKKKINKSTNYLYQIFKPVFNQNFEKIDIKLILNQVIGNFNSFDKNFFQKESIDSIMIKAEKILNNQYDILSFKEVLAVNNNWHKDFISDYEWTKGKFYKKYKIIDYLNDSDVKVCWEFNRCHHMIHLGQAYLITGDEKFAKKILFQINDWIDENPLMYSINWTCAMDVSIRAINWIYAFNMIIDSKIVDDNFIKKINKSLYQHGWFIYRNLEDNYDKESDNHYDSNLVGLLLLGLIFKSFKEGSKWKKFAVKELHRVIKFQIYPSGANFEKSINYSRLVNEFFTFSYILMKKNNISVSKDFKIKIEKQYEFLKGYVKGGVYAPIIGDQDDGRLLPFSIIENIDHSYLFTIGSILFNRSDFKSLSKNFNLDSFFLLGIDGKEKFDNIKNDIVIFDSKSYEEAGFFIMKNKDYYMFINNSGLGKYGNGNKSIGSHTHADMLSFELYILGYDILTDSGTYNYTRNIKERYYFSSTKMHNTLTVDGKNQFEIDKNKYNRFQSFSYPNHIKWISSKIKDVYIGEHNAYSRLESPATHRRKFEFIKDIPKWIITDYIISEGRHSIHSYLNFAQDLNPDIVNKNSIRVILKEFIVNIKFISKDINSINLVIVDDWCSKAYGSRFKRKKAIIEYNTFGNMSIETVITVEMIN